MRRSSEKRSIGKYRPESVRPDTGYGYGSGSGEQELPRLEERRAKEFAFVREHLADQHEGLAVSALLGLRQAGIRPTKKAILERLRATGRTADQLREKGWME